MREYFRNMIVTQNMKVTKEGNYHVYPSTRRDGNIEAIEKTYKNKKT